MGNPTDKSTDAKIIAAAQPFIREPRSETNKKLLVEAIREALPWAAQNTGEIDVTYGESWVTTVRIRYTRELVLRFSSVTLDEVGE